MSNNKPWKKLQELVARDIEGTESLQSGAIDGYKYDVIGSNLYIECKSSRAGDKILVKWMNKLENDYFSDGNAKHMPALVIAPGNNISNYKVLVHSKVIEILKEYKLDPPFLYGYNQKRPDPLLFVVEPNVRSFKIKSPANTKYFWNVVSLPGSSISHRQYILLDRDEFKFLARELRKIEAANDKLDE